MEEQRNEKDVNDSNNSVNETEEQDTVDNDTSTNEETKVVSKEDDSVKKTDNGDIESNDEESAIEDEDSDKTGFSLPDNINWKSVLIWGVVGFIFAFILVFLVSLISGTLAFVLGRLFLFGIVFFIAGAGIRLLLQIFAPKIFEDEKEEEAHLYNDDVSNISEENSDIGSNIDTSIDDKIETDPLWSEEKKEDDKKSSKNVLDKEKIKSKFGKDTDYIKVDGSDAVFPNNAELMAEGIRTMINKDEDN